MQRARFVTRVLFLFLFPLSFYLVTAQSTGSIRGVIKVASPVAARTLSVTTDQKTCGATVPDESLVTSADGGVANAVVILAGVKATTPPPDPTLTNRQCRFVPHVSIARPGGPLKIGSADNTLHTTHAYTENDSTLFNVAIPMPAISLTRPLDRPGVVRLACDSHPWMRAFIVVTPDLGAVTGENGEFALDGVPAGTYELKVWHERLPAASRKVTVSPGAAAEVIIVLANQS